MTRYGEWSALGTDNSNSGSTTTKISDAFVALQLCFYWKCCVKVLRSLEDQPWYTIQTGYPIHSGTSMFSFVNPVIIWCNAHSAFRYIRRQLRLILQRHRFLKKTAHSFLLVSMHAIFGVCVLFNLIIRCINKLKLSCKIWRMLVQSL